jgi:hypothetical protein
MDDLEQEIAIAKICGWTHTKIIHNPDPSAYGRHPVHAAGLTWDSPLPDYLNDLNAMHDAEMRMPSFEFVRYAKMIPPCATARYRAEALLKTLNLWEP